MIQNKIIKLKKYLFLISIVFFVISFIHLIYIFIYNDSKMVPIKGWTVSEWLIWTFPSLNPLKPLSWNNEYMVHLLYRSLLIFDTKENKIAWDLATCDISNMLNIECYLKDNIYWSDWTAITSDDVIATYNLLKTTWVNKVISSLLEETKIEKNNNSITFINSKKDVNFLNIFLQPILPKETIDSLNEDVIFWNFPTEWQLYSWEFKISSVSSDLTIWITKVYFDVNEYHYNWNIWKLVINIFPNTNSMLQNKETINIFNDDGNIIWDSIPRLEAHKYTLPQYTSLFLNINKIKDLNLRNYILEKINTENLIKLLWEDKFKLVNNPYLDEAVINSEISEKNFEKIIANLWYIKKSKIIEKFLPKTINPTEETSKITDNTKPLEDIKTVETPKSYTWELIIEKFQSDSKYIKSPTYVDKYNFITKDNTLLEWTTDTNTQEVYINDFKLTTYKKWSKYFYYRLKESYGTLKAWVNSLKIYFVVNWKKEFKEEIIFIYYKDKNILKTETDKFIKKLYEAELASNEKVVETPKQEVAKPQKIETKKIDVEKLEKINNLDEKYYYNDSLEKYTLSLYFLSTEKELEDTAKFIQNSLLEIWIDIKLVPMSINDLREVISNKDKYDMILAWVNLWLFNYNIFPYFHSSQVKNWYNFSNIKKTSLDILLEDLKWWIKTPEETNKIKWKVLDILKKEQIVKTLYTPKINLLIDKNIKNILLPEILVSKSARKDLFNSLYIKEEKIINFNEKWIINFFNFILQKLNN